MNEKMTEKMIIEKRIKLENKEDIINVNKITYFQNHIKALNEILIERKNIIDATLKAIIEKYNFPYNSNLSVDPKTQELVVQYEEIKNEEDGIK